MTNNQKKLLFFGVVGVVVITSIVLIRKNIRQQFEPVYVPEPAPEDKCPQGQKACANNPKKCYDPNVQYIVNPCS
jgi:hypothetical protein